MATTVAKYVVGSQVKKISRDIGDTVGLGGDGKKGRDEQAMTAAERRRLDSEYQQRERELQKEKQLAHAEREREREQIRAKYQLPAGGVDSGPRQSQSSERKKCVIS